MTSDKAKGHSARDGAAGVSQVHRRLAGLRSDRRGGSRRLFRFGPGSKVIEDRTLLSTITWNTTAHPNGGDWDTPGNWNGDAVPTSSDDAVIDLTSAGNVTLSSNLNDSVNSLSTNSDTTLKVENGSLTLGAGSSTLGGPVNVVSGATLSVAAGASVQIGSRSRRSPTMGRCNFATGDIVTFDRSQPAQIVVAGTLTASGTTFNNQYGRPSRSTPAASSPPPAAPSTCPSSCPTTMSLPWQPATM